MKNFRKIIAFVFVLGFFVFNIVSTSVAASNIFSDGFDSGDYSNWTSGNPESGKWEIDNSGHTGKAARVKGDNNTSKYLYKTISTTGYQSISLGYWYKTDSLESGDTVKAEWYDGSSWHTLFTISGNVSNWTQKNHSLPASADNLSTFKVRFLANLDSGNDKVWLDDVTLSGTEIPTKLIVKKVVINNDGGTATASNFSFSVNNGAATSFEADGQNDIIVAPGTYSVVETEAPGYKTTYNGCSNISLTNGQTKTCTITNNDKLDLCLNIPDYQESVPAGYHQVNQNDRSECVPDYVTVKLCKADDHEHMLSGWTLNLKGSSSDDDDDDDDEGHHSNNNENESNNYSGTTGGDGCVTFSHVKYGSYKVGEVMQSGWNQVSLPNGDGNIQAYESGHTYTVINHNNNFATISAKKIICPSEDLLPNWGSGGADITTSTATDFIEAHPTCHLEPWTFEWAPNGTNNPGDNVGAAGSPWTAFTTTATVPSGALVWMREQMKDGYVSFSGATSDLDSTNAKNSAELYCSNDVLNYDNFDFINPVEAGQTYHCIGFNAQIVTPPVDVCPNVNGVQTAGPCADQICVDQGGIWNIESQNCDQQTQCGDQTLDVVSDDSNTGGATVIGSPNVAWTSIPGASWIWDTLADFNGALSQTKTFSKTFNIIGAPISATLDVAADNAFIGTINGLGGDVIADPTEFNYGSVKSYNPLAYLTANGSNTISFDVTNFPVEGSTFDSNPAGLLYKLHVVSNDCPPVKKAGFIHIYKFVDGEQATIQTVDGVSFPMFNNREVNTYTLNSNGWSEGDIPYEATASESGGGIYSTWENLSTELVGASCTEGKPYALEGYSSGPTLQAAIANGTNKTLETPYFVIDGDVNVIVWNKKCGEGTPPVDGKVHIFKFVDGIQATSENVAGVSFPMNTPTYGNAPFTLDSDGWTEGDAPYEASTSTISAGGSYTANENLTTPLVGESCTVENPPAYELVGYSTGTTLELAKTATKSLTPPNLTIDGDVYMIVWNKKCGQVEGAHTLKVHIYKYVTDIENPTPAQIVDNNSVPAFPMTATWMTANLNGGDSTSGDYVLGNYHGGATLKYAADTSPMESPADYTTSEVTDGNVVLPINSESCPEGKYRLQGYKSGDTLEAAQSAAISLTAPVYTDITTDRYVIVVNEKCPNIFQPTTARITVVKHTIGGDGTFHFTGLGEEGFNLTTNAENNHQASSFFDVFPEINGSSYTITEVVPQGWNLTSTSCLYGNQSAGTEVQNGKIVTLDPGDEVTCTFTNTKQITESGPTVTSGGGGGGGCLPGQPCDNRIGKVLGASTTCGIYVDKFLRRGYKNDVDAVKKIQKFLNDYMNAGLTENGIFDSKTEKAIKKFQAKYSDEILKPWGFNAPTGIFYIASQTKVNNLMCPDLKLTLPKLTPFETNPLSPKKED